jgi:hypothetical protein
MKTLAFLAALGLSIAGFASTASTAEACGRRRTELTPAQDIERVLLARFAAEDTRVSSQLVALGDSTATARVVIRRGGVEHVRRVELSFQHPVGWRVTVDRLLVMRSIA